MSTPHSFPHLYLWIFIRRRMMISCFCIQRIREYLLQHGYSAFRRKKEAYIELLDILELYQKIYEDYLAIPVVKGKKSVLETIAGGLHTTSVELLLHIQVGEYKVLVLNVLGNILRSCLRLNL
ncbi:hypothetical protein KSP40_PGU019450 [Platanthera guangdongensis]|uniref:Uncharacterized protein n=1 Tax=Platanthera guangdongensis TaxID=2320717 RepID=A0ABR2MBY8_9ASPA